MVDPVEEGARAAARRIGAGGRPELVEAVEAALYERGSGPRRDHYTDPTALGSLIVSVATLAWTVYNDIRGRAGSAPAPDAVARRVRQRLDGNGGGLDPDELARIIAATVDETLNAAGDEGRPPPAV
jgi:hypothetical protein